LEFFARFAESRLFLVEDRDVLEVLKHRAIAERGRDDWAYSSCFTGSY
jgi:hypothetical protein